MAHNQTGIAIVIKAFLPTGKTLDEQFAALSIVKDAHATSDYCALLAAAQIDEVKTEQKTRRVEDVPVVAEVEAEPEFAEVDEPTGTILRGIDEDAGLSNHRVNPDDEPGNDALPWGDDPLDQPVAEPEPARRLATK